MGKGRGRKKISCFVALPHHTRFMHPVLEELAKKKDMQIEYFTTAADFPFEKALVEKSKSCKILQDYIDDEMRERISNSKKEFYRQWSASQFSWQGLRQWPVVIQTVMINDGITEYHLLEKYIQTERPDLFMALHERNRWGKLIGHLARKYGIPYVSFQEGDYYEDRISFSGHTEYSTALLLWGRDTAARLTGLSAAPEKMVLTGNTHLNAVSSGCARKNTRMELNIPADKTVVLIMVGLQWGIIQDVAVWKKFLQGLRTDVLAIFKWHPKVNYRNFQEKILPMFHENFPNAIVVQNYDPYDLIQASDYCVTLGKTTLAVEALCLDRPVFSVAGTDGNEDHYLAMGVTQAVGSEGEWQALHDTMDRGLPVEVANEVQEFLQNYFTHNNRQAIQTSVHVIHNILESRAHPLCSNGVDLQRGEKPVSGRSSFILASGSDAEHLMMSVLGLAERVGLEDWELVVVLQDPAMTKVLDAVSGDIRYVHAFGANLSQAYNKGILSASGEWLFFLRPGCLVSGDMPEAMESGVLYSFSMHSAQDGKTVSVGQSMDFNAVPRLDALADGSRLPNPGLLACHRQTMIDLGGFDEFLDDSLVEVDLGLLAAKNSISTVFSQPHYILLQTPSAVAYETDWQGRIHFFAKWQGEYEKSETFYLFEEQYLV